MADKRDMVQIEALEKYFGEDKERVHVLKGVSLNVPEGSLYTFLGPSGCGKTTTLRCVAGLERPDGGRISIAGHTVYASGERVYVPTNKRPIGMVFPFFFFCFPTSRMCCLHCSFCRFNGGCYLGFLFCFCFFFLLLFKKKICFGLEGVIRDKLVFRMLKHDHVSFQILTRDFYSLDFGTKHLITRL